MAYVVFDIDGTIGAAPAESQELASAMKAAGHRVGVLTGSSNFPLTQDDFDAKVKYLVSLGFGESYDDLTVISNQVKGGLAAAKGKYCADNGVDIYLDNNKENAQAAIEAGVEFVLVPWATRV